MAQPDWTSAALLWAEKRLILLSIGHSFVYVTLQNYALIKWIFVIFELHEVEAALGN